MLSLYSVLFLPTLLAAKGTPAGWEEVAKRLHESMNEKADACDDFYEFACGNWKKEHHRPSYADYWDGLFEVGQTNKLNISHAINIMDLKKQPRSVQQLKIYYDHCIKGSAEPNKEFLRKILAMYGNWPLIDQNWQGPVGGATFKNASALIGHLMGHYFGVGTFMGAMNMPSFVMPLPFTSPDDERRKETLVIAPTPPEIQANTTQHQLAEDITKLALDLTLEPLDLPMLLEEAAELAELEMKFKKALPLPAVGYPLCEHESLLVSDMKKKWPYFDWNVLMTKFAQNNTDLKNVFGNRIIVCAPKAFDNLTTVINGIKKPRLMQDFLLWKLLTAANQLKFEPLGVVESFHTDSFHKEHLGKDAPIAIKCTTAAIAYLPMLTGRIYVDMWRPLVPSNTISMLQDMTAFIFAAFRGMLQDLDWLDGVSKKAAMGKLNYLTRVIAYNKDILDDAALNEFHKGLHLNKDDDPFATLVRVNQFIAWANFRKIGQNVDYSRMMSSAGKTNAIYVPFLNQMEIDAGIINLPLFQTDRPLAVNYGAIGAVLGHELTHGFDMSGVMYDAFGVYHPEGWMSKKSMAKFIEMARCVINQYDKYCYPNINETTICVHGQQTVSENIADAGGLMAAYRAYKDIIELSGKEQRLPKPMENYTMEQVFFISYGHMWCNSYNAEGLIHKIQKDTHSPDTTRVNGTLQNIPDFATEFKCKEGSKMAPKDHCNVWVKKKL